MLSKHKKAKISFALSQRSIRMELKADEENNLADRLKNKSGTKAASIQKVPLVGSPPFYLPEAEVKNGGPVSVSEINALLRFSLDQQATLKISDNCGFIVQTLHKCLNALGVENKVMTGFVDLNGKEVPSMWLKVLGYDIDNTYVKGLGKSALAFLKSTYPKCYREDNLNDEDFKESLFCTSNSTAKNSDPVVNVDVPNSARGNVKSNPRNSNQPVPSSCWTRLREKCQSISTKQTPISGLSPTKFSKNVSPTEITNLIRKQRIRFYQTNPDKALALVLNNCSGYSYFFAMIRYMDENHGVSTRGIDSRVRYSCWGCGRFPRRGLPFIANVLGEVKEQDAVDPTEDARGPSWRFPQCSRCGVANYCSTACQADDWARGHCVCCIQHDVFCLDLPAMGDTSALTKSSTKATRS